MIPVSTSADDRRCAATGPGPVFLVFAGFGVNLRFRALWILCPRGSVNVGALPACFTPVGGSSDACRIPRRHRPTFGHHRHQVLSQSRTFAPADLPERPDNPIPVPFSQHANPCHARQRSYGASTLSSNTRSDRLCGSRGPGKCSPMPHSSVRPNRSNGWRRSLRSHSVQGASAQIAAPRFVSRTLTEMG